LYKVHAGLVFLFALFLLLITAFSSCKKEEPKPELVIRTIKWMQVSEPSFGQVRMISGVVNPVDVSRLSFRVSGKVVKVTVDLGSRVKQGDVLAELDKEPFILEVRKAEAELQEAQAVLREKELTYKRYIGLFEGEFISESELDKARAEAESGKSRVQAAKVRLAMTRRDLDWTVLKSPFAGVISKKEIEPFEEVQSGQAIFEIHNENQFEVSTEVPEPLVRYLAVGQQHEIIFPTLRGAKVIGKITEIGTRSEAANTFPVTVTLIDTVPDILAGMSVEVAYAFHMSDSNQASLIPLPAILSGPDNQYFVFLFDEKTSTVQKTPVKIQNIYGNKVEVTDGIQPGRIIATAGVQFLENNQPVKLFEEVK
jgi:RND family efflux transporter MFP subunit